MKKLYLITLALIMCISLGACQNAYPTTTPTLPATETVLTETTKTAPPITESTPDDTIPSTTPKDTSIIELRESKDISCTIKKKLDGILVGQIISVSSNGDRTTITYHIVTDEFDKWDIGDTIDVEYHKYEQPGDGSPMIVYADKICLTMFDKPIIYLYPEEPTKCSVTLAFNGKLTCSYPAYGEKGWSDFVAYPDGTLIFPDGKEYYALYWEGNQWTDWDFSQGFCVKGEETAAFLEWALEKQGLTRREANEFIIYWLPRMQDNSYNVISFQTDVYTDSAVLNIDPKPDSLLRVFMAYYPSDTEVEIAPQEFEVFTRQGFTVVEWGGSEAPKKESAIEAQYIRTGSGSDEKAYPYCAVINSKEELMAYYEANKEFYDLEQSIGFLDACEKYDKAYFERQSLVLIILEEGSGSIRHKITDISERLDENGKSIGWNISIERLVPECGTCDMALWHLFLEVPSEIEIHQNDNLWISKNTVCIN